MQNTAYGFEFLNVEKPFESYTGSNVRLRYIASILNFILAAIYTCLIIIVSLQILSQSYHCPKNLRYCERTGHCSAYIVILPRYQ